jgi:hypothetical protein
VVVAATAIQRRTDAEVRQTFNSGECRAALSATGTSCRRVHVMLVTRLPGMNAGPPLNVWGLEHVSEAAEYRALANECWGWAKTARTDRERRIFLQITEAWPEAAALAERMRMRAT